MPLPGYRSLHPRTHGLTLLTTLVVLRPLALRKLPLSLPIVCIALGAALFSLPQITLKPLPLLHPETGLSWHRPPKLTYWLGDALPYCEVRYAF